MKHSTKLAITSISAIILALGCLTTAVAQSPVYIYEDGSNAASTGIIEVGGAKFDSTDLNAIYTEVNTGKSNINAAIVAKGGSVTGTGTGGIITFVDLVNGINSAATTQYNNGKEATWQDIRDASSAGTISSNYSSVNSIDTLKDAIDADNISYAINHPNVINANIVIEDVIPLPTSKGWNVYPGWYSDIIKTDKHYDILLCTEPHICEYRNLPHGCLDTFPGDINDKDSAGYVNTFQLSTTAKEKVVDDKREDGYLVLYDVPANTEFYCYQYFSGDGWYYYNGSNMYGFIYNN